MAAAAATTTAAAAATAKLLSSRSLRYTLSDVTLLVLGGLISVRLWGRHPQRAQLLRLPLRLCPTRRRLPRALPCRSVIPVRSIRAWVDALLVSELVLRLGAGHVGRVGAQGLWGYLVRIWCYNGRLPAHEPLCESCKRHRL